MRSLAVFSFLWLVKWTSRVFFRVRLEWLRPEPDPWSDLRVLALLNHTSLFEPIFAAAAPNRLLWQLAAHGVIPIADKTMKRPVVGQFFRRIGRHVVSITRERDETWKAVLSRIHDPKALVVILPEGRMKRRSGLDSHGRPMTVRGGIADILEAIPTGKMLVGYSQGLHHVHVPGERAVHLFRHVVIRAETLDIAEYRDEILRAHGEEHFKIGVVEDLTRRRDAECAGCGEDAPSTPEAGATSGAPDEEVAASSET